MQSLWGQNDWTSKVVKSPEERWCRLKPRCFVWACMQHLQKVFLSCGWISSHLRSHENHIWCLSRIFLTLRVTHTAWLGKVFDREWFSQVHSYPLLSMSANAVWDIPAFQKIITFFFFKVNINSFSQNSSLAQWEYLSAKQCGWRSFLLWQFTQICVWMDEKTEKIMQKNSFSGLRIICQISG